jgi:RNAse (barnase) inhibitor barstar
MPNSNVWWTKHLQSCNGCSIHVLPDEPKELTALREAVSGLKFELFSIYGEEISSKDLLLDYLARAMAFPEYFGRNWDALDECMNDLSWWDARGFVLVYERADILLAHSPKDFETLIQIVADASTSWYVEGTPFHVIITGPSSVAQAVTRTIQEMICNHQLL